MDFLHKLHSPEGMQDLIAWGGYVLLFAIIFAETGLLVGFFLPGDSLLFVTGAIAAQPKYSESLNIVNLIVLLCIAAISGDAVGYFIGRKVGTRLYSRPDSRLFKRKHLIQTQEFYDKHGPKTIVLARFVPIVRTFAPTVAGIAGMNYRTFVSYNVFGGIGWITSMLLLGYFLGSHPWVSKNFDKAVLGIVFLSVLPIIIHWWQERKHSKSSNTDSIPLTFSDKPDVPVGARSSDEV